MDTKGLISPTSNGNSYLFVIIDAFNHFIITSQTPVLILNTQSIPFSTTGLQNLPLLNI